jgi:uncharacterized coiled-coil DUF342 family protein
LQDEYQRMAELRQRAAALERRLASTKEERSDLIKERREMLERAANMKSDVDGAAKERDLANEKVHAVKRRIDALMEGISSIKAKVEERGGVLDGLRGKLVGDEGQLSSRLGDLEWRLVTTGASAKEEAEIVSSIAELKRRLAPYEGAKSIAQELRAMRERAAKLRGELRGLLEEKRSLVEEAHRRHDSFLQRRDERIDVLKGVDKIREEEAKLKEREDKEYMDMVSAGAEIHILQMKLRRTRDEQIQESRQQERALKSHVAQLAAQKLKRGETLSWDEFKIMLESQEHVDGVPQ